MDRGPLAGSERLADWSKGLHAEHIIPLPEDTDLACYLDQSTLFLSIFWWSNENSESMQPLMRIFNSLESSKMVWPF